VQLRAESEEMKAGRDGEVIDLPALSRKGVA
jgi:hypothetical protein